MTIDDITLKQIKELKCMFGIGDKEKNSSSSHPMVGRRCLVRTYSAGVHIGDVISINEMECHLKNALRLWKWEGGGLSLSAVANNGIKGGRINETREVYLTNCIEFIPTTEEAEKTFVRFIEDKNDQD